MREKKKYKELILRSDTPINIKYGTVDYHDPKVIYITLKGWVIPMENEDSKEIQIILNKFKKNLQTTLKKSSIFNDKLIYCVDFTALPLLKTKRNSLEIEFYVKPYIVKNLFEIKDDILSTFNSNFNELIYDIQNLSFQMKRGC